MAHGMDHPSLYGMLQEINECSVCLEEFSNPKFLPCGHTFCLGCLESIFSQSPFGNITCGICRDKHKVPQKGVVGFPNDHRVQQIKDAIVKRKPKQAKHKHCVVCSNKASDLCLDCDETMCQKCTTQHQTIKHFSKHIVVKMIDSVECGHHKEKLVTRYCMSCCCLVCKGCIISNHAAHEISLLKMQDSNQSFPSASVRKLEEELQKNEAQYTANLQTIERSSRDIKSAVEAQAQRLIGIIQRNKQEIMKKSEDIHKRLRDDQYKHKSDLQKSTDQIKKIKIAMDKMFNIYPAAGIIPEKVSQDSFKHDLEVIQQTTISAIVSQCKFVPSNSLDVGEISVVDVATRGNRPASTPSPVDTRWGVDIDPLSVDAALSYEVGYPTYISCLCCYHTGAVHAAVLMDIRILLLICPCGYQRRTEGVDALSYEVGYPTYYDTYRRDSYLRTQQKDTNKK